MGRSAHQGKAVAIVGAGIGGLSLGLTLHQIGIQCRIYEAVCDLKPLGVGINIQPNAVRELFDLGFTKADLDAIGVPVKEWALVGLRGQEIYAEPRGTLAGYRWPQYAVHRGKLQMMLYNRLCERAGNDVLRLGHKAVSYQKTESGSVNITCQTEQGLVEEQADILIAADGIHSLIRAQMHDSQPPIHWGGAIMWRGTSLAKPLRSGSSFIGLGTHRQRMVMYPISPPDPETGLALTNWIAEITSDDPSDRDRLGWFQPTSTESFVHRFNDWVYDWLNVPELITQNELAFENPMIDRDPVSTWVDGPVALLGDAAHAMYPTGSNGASQAIIDARILGAKFLNHGISQKALEAYDTLLCEPISALVLRNRGAGPFGLLNMVNERCGGDFSDIDTVISKGERNAFMAKYKSAAGFSRDELNSAPPVIAAGSSIRS